MAIVGTGSTASQLVPTLQPVVGKLYLFQREPGWVIPKGDRDYTREERLKLHNPIVHRFRRAKWYWTAEKHLWNGGSYRPGYPANTNAEQVARHYIAKVFEDRPDLADAVTPKHPYWGKRTIFSSAFYPALKEPNVELVPRAVASVTRRGVVDVDGIEREVDVLVIATGFQPTNYLAHLEVVGREGRTLHEYWDGEPRAFLGVTVPTFPNFYMLYGPGTNGGEIALNLRNQAAYARRGEAHGARASPPSRSSGRGPTRTTRGCSRRWRAPRGRCRTTTSRPARARSSRSGPSARSTTAPC